MPRTGCLLLLALVLSTTSLGCEVEVREETVIFEEAERRYRTGDYEAASAYYQRFLSVYPRSPLAATAELRIRTIEREVEAIMDARSGNRPLYVKPGSVAPGPRNEKPNPSTPPPSAPSLTP